MHLHFQSNQKKCKVRHGASNNIKYLGFFLTREFQTESRLELWKRSRFSEGKRKGKGNARILASKEKKKFNCKIRGVTACQAHLGTHLLMGPSWLVNKDLGTQEPFVLALGKLITFLTQVAILGCLVT
jgi:hypothetical protein